MESRKLISIDMDSLANSNIATNSTSNVSNNSKSHAEKKYQIADFKNYSETFRNLLALFDEPAQLSPKEIAQMCAKLNITEPHRVQIYEYKAKNRENYLLNLFSDCQNEIKYFESILEFLNSFESTKFLVQSLRKEQKFIFDECERNRNSAISFQFSLRGNKISFKSQSQSSLSTNSSSDSEKTLKTNALLVFTSNQQILYQERIKRFKIQLEKLHISLKDLNLSKKFDNGISNEFQRWENWPIILLFDKEIDDHIDYHKKNDARQPFEFNNIEGLYLQLYIEYLRSGSNKRFYVFVLDDYKSYCLHTNGIFRYHWLLKKVTDANGNERIIPPVRIPEGDKSNSDSIYYEKYLEYLRRTIRPFCQSSVL